LYRYKTSFNIDCRWWQTGYRGEYLDPRGSKWRNNGEDYITRSFIIYYALKKYYKVDQVREDERRMKWVGM
jgi:hypothetical protein